ncbi:MAG: bifunctional ornithine acetyltransferase/N-acetylglutamate synthase, partial [Alphaproteobacteria bacterium]
MLLPVPGLVFTVWASGLRYRERDDTVLFRLPAGSVAAQVTTRSATVAAPIGLSRRHAQAAEGRLQALLVHAGNAIALLGPAGEEACDHLATRLAEALGIPREETRIAATGVIGLPFDAAALAARFNRLDDWQSARWERPARAIMTTDTFPKGAGALARIDGEPVVVTGIAKGSGMIRPDMATMLAFLFTNARLPHAVL